jgi:hypothetical protein
MYDMLGTLFWLSTYIGLGYIFAAQIELIARNAASLGSWLVFFLALGLIVYILYKFAIRQKFLRDLRIARISVDELKRKIDAGEALSIVDLRHSLDFEADPETIPGALRLDSKDLAEKNGLLPLDREIVLYCT